MEPNKIEKQIKESMKNRAIQPSPEAWDRLDSMLTISEKKSKPNYNWITIAATLIGFSIVGIVLMNTYKSFQPNERNNPIVKETILPIEIEENKLELEGEVIMTDLKPLVQSSSKIEKIKVKTTRINPKEEAFLDLKVEEQVVLIPNTTPKANQNKYVNALALLAEIESKEVPIIEKKVNPTKIIIDPQTLLSEAEQEVNESFRTKVIQSINKNYNSIKSTLANRNYE